MFRGPWTSGLRADSPQNYVQALVAIHWIRLTRCYTITCNIVPTFPPRAYTNDSSSGECLNYCISQNCFLYQINDWQWLVSLYMYKIKSVSTQLVYFLGWLICLALPCECGFSTVGCLFLAASLTASTAALSWCVCYIQQVLVSQPMVYHISHCHCIPWRYPLKDPIPPRKIPPLNPIPQRSTLPLNPNIVVLHVVCIGLKTFCTH